MKIILGLALLLFITKSYSQSHPYGTTLEEYNYVTKGYATQIDQGLDMKAGYEFASENGYGEFYGTSVLTLGDETEIIVEVKLLVNSSKVFNERAIMLIMTYDDYARYLCIPNNYSDDEIWFKYFEDLEFLEKNELLALTWALSKSKSAVSLFCFPGDALVNMADGTMKPIMDIHAGDQVKSVDFSTRKLEVSQVEELEVHEQNQFSLYEIILSGTDGLHTSIKNVERNNLQLQGTGNHPVYTNHGVKNLNEITLEDKVYYFSNDLNSIISCQVISAPSIVRTANMVYNLKLKNNNNYLINGMIVRMK